MVGWLRQFSSSYSDGLAGKLLDHKIMKLRSEHRTGDIQGTNGGLPYCCHTVAAISGSSLHEDNKSIFSIVLETDAFAVHIMVAL